MFYQLDADDINYIRELITDDTALYCSRQRSLTSEKIAKIEKEPFQARLAFQDVEYITELIEDDEAEHCRLQREKTIDKIEAIRAMQEEKFSKMKEREDQRKLRSLTRLHRNAVDNPVISMEEREKIYEK